MEVDAKNAENGDAGKETIDANHPYINNEDFKRLISAGFKSQVATEVVEMILADTIKYDELEDRTLDILKSLKVEHAIRLLTQFKEANLMGVANKAAFLGTCVKSFKDRMRQQGAELALAVPCIRGPDPVALKAILDRTKYSLEVTIGQRKYGGPPPNYQGGQPDPGNEVYVGRIPREMFEDELIPLFEVCGQIYDLRLMMDPLTSHNKGYGFVTFVEKSAAHEAAKKYDEYEIKDGKKLKVNVSVANTRLFVGNIPKTKTKEEITEEMGQYAENITDVIVYASPDDDSRKNRGFCFLQFVDHKSASAAKRKMQAGKVRPWGRDVVVDWAEPQAEVDEDAMQEVKVLYIRNLRAEVTEETLNPLFAKYGELEKIKRLKDYAFVHFMKREDALKAMEELNGHEFSGVPCEISLAKPQVDKKRRDQMMRDRERRQIPRGRGFGRGMGGPMMGRGMMRGGGFRGRGGPPGMMGGFDPYGYGGGYEDPYGYGGGYGGDPYGYGGYGGGFGGEDPYGYGFGGPGGGMGGGYDDFGGYGGYGGGWGPMGGGGPMGGMGGGMRGGRGRGSFGGGGGSWGRGGRGNSSGARAARGATVGAKRKQDDESDAGAKKVKEESAAGAASGGQDFTSDY